MIGDDIINEYSMHLQEWYAYYYSNSLLMQKLPTSILISLGVFKWIDHAI